jgi:hypothetical protein
MIGHTGELEVDVERSRGIRKEVGLSTRKMGVHPSIISLTARSPLRKEDLPAHGRPAGAGTLVGVRSD